MVILVANNVYLELIIVFCGVTTKILFIFLIPSACVVEGIRINNKPVKSLAADKNTWNELQLLKEMES